ncbi:cysteine peptidase family C39 domain-containing protein, partial [Halomonas elongata]|uniref:cysteine peptidase family C39 domain-containing protein n=1 Tax=Halomonas elongata TaxID=2746 RepID=UPI00255B2FAC
MDSATRTSVGHMDSLREGLVLLCRQLGCPTSVAELGDGLALEQGCLPLELVPRALRRAGVSARVIEADIEALSEELLPALLCFEDGHSVVLVAYQDDEAILLTPESNGGRVNMPLARLRARHTGTTVVARPAYHPDERAGDFAREREEHWFKGPLKRRWKTFGEVGVAAMMANMLAISTALFAMQVYDRVVPNEAFETLWILASGVALAVLMEFVLRC